jgi:hypothetical protein
MARAAGIARGLSGENSSLRLISSDNPPVEHPTGPTRPAGSSGATLTLPLLCAGIATIACCVLIPLADQNRRLVYQREVLQRDLDHVRMQIALNDEFLQRLGRDAALAERLAQRQMNMVRQGSRVLEIGEAGGAWHMSPFRIVHVPPPEPLPEYEPVGGRVAELCREPRSRLYLLGGGLLLMACGLILGAARRD